MRVAITGATGFVGRSVLAELDARSIETIAVVRPSSDSMQEKLDCDTVEFDLYDAPSDAFELMGRPDILIHLAWSGLPNYKSLHHFEQELPNQYRFLKSMIESGLQSLVVAGTCFEYGMQSGPQNEDATVHPSNPYGFAKDALRCQLEFLKKTNSYQLAWARLFYLFGEGQAESSLLPQLRLAAEGGEKKFNLSGGEQLRDYLSVADVASYLVSISLLEQDVGIVNVCSGTPISIRKVVEGWIEENAWSIKLNLGYYPYPDYEPMAFWGDPKKLLSLLGKTI